MRRALYFLPALLFYALIFLVSSQGRLGFSLPGNWLDKITHTLEFTVLGCFLSLGFFHVRSSPRRLTIVLTFLVGAVLGGLDEFHQKFVSGRSSDPKDAVADAIGIILGISIYAYWHRKKAKRPAA